jgi:hypothetical protein
VVTGAALMLLRAAIGRLTRHWLDLEVALTVAARRALIALMALLALALTVRQQLMVGILR